MDKGQGKINHRKESTNSTCAFEKMFNLIHNKMNKN